MEWSRSDKISALSVLIALMGFVVVVYQLHEGIKQYQKAQITQRAQFLSHLHERAFGSNEIIALFQDIEYKRFEFKEDYRDRGSQQALFKLLSFFELIGQLKEFGLISKDDVFKMFGYYIYRTYTNDEVKKCLNHLSRLSANKSPISSSITFPKFQELGLELSALYKLDTSGETQ